VCQHSRVSSLLLAVLDILPTPTCTVLLPLAAALSRSVVSCFLFTRCFLATEQPPSTEPTPRRFEAFYYCTAILSFGDLTGMLCHALTHRAAAIALLAASCYQHSAVLTCSSHIRCLLCCPTTRGTRLHSSPGQSAAIDDSTLHLL
jgi:hypothetical protein